ncbi:MAG: sulfite exporter TauE/SafE family protein [Bacteroidetes bacterium]|nr:sulfite exporter TauE/SafE family protein [Bacteroidota bacterium]
MNLDFSLVQNASLLAFALVFLGGVLTSLGPCNVAMIPLVVGYIGSSHDLPRARAFLISLTFALGLALTFMLLGLAAALIGGLVGAATTWWYYLVAFVCFVIGLNMLGLIQIEVPLWLGGLREKVTLKGLPGALGLGLVSGLVASQCATPVLAAILTYVMAEGALLYGAALLFVYALGRGLPIVLAGTFTGILKQMQSLGRWNNLLEKAAGVVIIAVGLYFVWIA